MVALVRAHQDADPSHLVRLLRARRERPHGRRAEERYELASPHCPRPSASIALNPALQLGNVSLPSRIRISVLDRVYFYFSNKKATVRGCVTLLAALRGLDAPRSILTEKFWVLRMSATTIYVGRADSCSTQSACDVVS